VVESKLIVLNAKDGDKLNLASILFTCGLNFKDILKGGGHILRGSVPSVRRSRVVSITLTSMTPLFIIALILLNIHDADRGQLHGDHVYSRVCQPVQHQRHTVSMSFNKTTGKLTTTKTAGVYDIVYLSGSIYEVLGCSKGGHHSDKSDPSVYAQPVRRKS
jgi:hypothetical protein